MRYTTIAVKPETKRRLDKLRRSEGVASMDELVSKAVAEYEVKLAAERIRESVRRNPRRVKPSPLTEEFEEAMEGLDDTLRAIREGWKRRHARNARP